MLVVVLHISFHLFIRFRAFENFACCFSFCLSDSVLLKTLHVVFHFVSDSVLLKISHVFFNFFLRFTASGDPGCFHPPTGFPRNLLVMIMQIIGATGACAMGGCQHPCLWCLTRVREYAGAGHGFWQNVSGGRAFALSFGLVAIGTQAV